MSADFGAIQRSIANRALTKILLMGLGGSTLLHTVAIAGVSYWVHHHSDEQTEFVEIERVEIPPEPSPAPSTKPIPKVVKPPVTASIPTPIPVKIPTPKAISTPIPVVKAAKSVAIKRRSSPLSNIVLPAANRVSPPAKIASITPQKSKPTPSFPDQLFSDPRPKTIPFQPAIKARTQTPRTLPQQTKIATQKIENNPPPSSPIKYPQPTTANNKTAFAPNNQPAKLAPNSIPDRTDDPPTDGKLIPSWPGNTSKSAQTPEREILIGDRNSGNRLNPDRDLIGGTPGNNTQTARNNGGDNGVKLGNQTNLGRGNRQGSIGSGVNGNDNSNSGSSNKPGTGTHGNIATGSKNRVSIQCLRNCDIRYPDELENSDIGKDKILVKVTVNPNGMITNAEIARSSGNQNLDRVTLEGVKQMQLNATGQTQIYRIKVSTLLR
jgi:TonB family protein